jgi:hypothetical protein
VKNSILIEIEDTNQQESGLRILISNQFPSSEDRLEQSVLIDAERVRTAENYARSPVDAAPLTAILLACLCFTSIFGVVVLTASAFCRNEEKEGKIRVADPFELPCQTCRFFSRNQHLRCAVHPSIVLTEQALNCPDYCPQ